MRVGYLGPAGTVSHDALLSAAGPFEACRCRPARRVLAVQEGRSTARWCRSRTRSRARGRDARRARLRRPDVAIVGELVQPVYYCLTAGGALELAEVRTIVSHPQAIGQCARLLRERCRAHAVVTAPSTADAVRQVAGGDRRRRGARARARAAEHYGGDDPAPRTSRTTRTTRPASPGSPARTAPRSADAIARPAPRPRSCSGAPAPPRPGWLVRCLSEFASRGVNLTRIESRPLRQRLGEYMFFLDLEGSIDEAAVADAVAGLRAHAEMSCECSGRFQRPDERPALCATLRQAMSSSVDPQTTTGVRAAPMTTSGTDLNSDGSGRWSGGRVLGAQRDVRADQRLHGSARRRCCCSRRRPRSSSSARTTCTGRRGSLPRPVVIRLVTYVRVPRDSHKRKITRRAVFARDGWQCQYCGARTSADRRPRDPALEGRRVGLGQHRRLVRAVQSPQGRPAAAPGRTCTRASSRARPPRTSSSSSRRRRSRRRGASTCRSPEAA